MNEQDRVLLTVCSSEMQARMLVSELMARGINPDTNPVGGGGLVGNTHVEVRVPPYQIEEARSVVADLGGGGERSLLDPRRLLPALAVLIVMILIIVGVVTLLT